MSGAVLEKVPLMGGELEIGRFANRPKYWYFHMYVRASLGARSAPTSIEPSGPRKGQKQSGVLMRSGGSSRRSKRTVVP